jgi:hypothetical protein
MRIIQSRPIGTFPDFSNIKDEATRKTIKDLCDILLKQHRNISDDLNNIQNTDMVDTLPTAASEYRGRLLILKGAGTGADGAYLCIDTGGGGYTFKQITLT